MNEYSILWLVVTALVTLIGLFFTVGKPIIKLNSILTELNIRMETVEEDINSMISKNHDAHSHIHKRIDDVSKDVSCIEKKVERLETNINDISSQIKN